MDLLLNSEQRVSTKIRVVIIQDHAELRPSKRYISSIPVLVSTLEKCTVITTEPSSIAVSYEESIFGKTNEIAVLYPSTSSTPLEKCMLAEDSTATSGDVNFKQPIKTIIALDGSWVTVQHILARNSWLHPVHCRHIRLPPSATSQGSLYASLGLRIEPCRDFLSTAEAVAHALYYLEEKEEATTTILLRFNALLSKILHDREITADDSDITCSKNIFTSCRLDTNEVMLLPDKGIRYKHPQSKTEKRIREREKEKKRNKRR